MKIAIATLGCKVNQFESAAISDMVRTLGYSFVRFSERDVVRHELVQKIILAYERHGRREPGPAAPGGDG